MGGLSSSLEKGTDVPENAVLLDATIADNQGNPYTIPNAGVGHSVGQHYEFAEEV